MNMNQNKPHECPSCGELYVPGMIPHHWDMCVVLSSLKRHCDSLEQKLDKVLEAIAERASGGEKK